MVSVSAERLGAQAQNVIEERDIVGWALVAGSAAGGVVVSQYAADFVLEQLGMNVTPQNLKEYAASVGTKVATAAAFGLAAAQIGGIGLAVAGLMGIGAIASAGTDLVEALLSQSVSGNRARAPAQGQQTARAQITAKQSAGQPSPQSSGAATAEATAGGDNF